jgi:hypothetical protein
LWFDLNGHMKTEAGKREKGKAAVGRRTFPHCGTGTTAAGLL